MAVIILGGGLAGLSLAYFLNEKSIILEKEEQLGGLCRSFDLNKIKYDVGPHILFSKNKEALSKLTSLIKTNLIKRSNKIFHKGKFIKYPFENGLAKLEEDEKEWCLKEFLNNPYEDYDPKNMLQFFLKTFGEGITRIYLQPYNEKIWKFDPAFMDTQMVERIPKPPKQDLIDSAKGIEIEGYTHQLYFHYPIEGGIQTLISSYAHLLAEKSQIINPVQIIKILKKENRWIVQTDKGEFGASTLINCMPLHELFNYLEPPMDVKEVLDELKYNSIYILALQSKKDNLKDNFVLNFADKNIIFHRLSKLNFLGENYQLQDGGSTILAEITYRPNSYLDSLGNEAIKQKVVDDLDRLDLVKKDDITALDLKRFKYAYVIYDLSHRKNTDRLLKYLSEIGIYCCGRFAEFEYLNMDGIIDHSYKLSEKLNSMFNEQAQKN